MLGYIREVVNFYRGPLGVGLSIIGLDLEHIWVRVQIGNDPDLVLLWLIMVLAGSPCYCISARS